MTSRDFAYWLQGLFEVAEPKTLNERQTDLIKRHLNLVFIHEIDPSQGDAAHQAKLNAVHNLKPPTPEQQIILDKINAGEQVDYSDLPNHLKPQYGQPGWQLHDGKPGVRC